MYILYVMQGTGVAFTTYVVIIYFLSVVILQGCYEHWEHERVQNKIKQAEWQKGRDAVKW
jgi:hypothetical protein